MKYILTTKLPPPDDTSRECFDSPGESDADLYLRSLADDIQGLTSVKSVTRHGFVFTIEVDGETTQRDLKAAMKPYFSEDRFCTTRFVSLEPT